MSRLDTWSGARPTWARGGKQHLELDVPVGDALAVAEVQRHDELLEEPARQVLGETPAVAERLRGRGVRTEVGRGWGPVPG